MKKTIKLLLALSMLTSFATFYACNPCATGTNCGTNCGTCCNNCSSCCNCDNDCTYMGICDGYPYLQIRSQGRDNALKLVGEEAFTNKYGLDSTNGVFAMTAEYTQSFWNDRLTNFYFGSDMVNCCNLLVQGSAVADRNPKAWLADYFGLPGDYNSKISFCPKIQNFIFDMDLYLGLDGWTEGLYMRFNAPIAWTKWQLCPSECFVDKGTASMPIGYMSTSTIARADLPASFLQAMSGCSTFGDMTTPMKYGRFNNCCNTEAGLAEFDFTFGWNFHLEEDHHFGLYLYAAAPTGTRPSATYLFEPIIGNGKHWELGGGISASWTFWRSQEHDSRYMGIWFDGMVSTMFKADQCRSFDLKCQPNSRYMLLEKLTAPTNLTGPATAYTPSNYEYAGSLVPMINWSTMCVDVSIPAQGDLAIKLTGVRDNWSFDLGYDFWARTGEKFCNDCCNTCNPSDVYAIKGAAQLYGRYSQTTDTEPNATTKTPLALTESTANIHGLATTADNVQNAFYTYNSNHQTVYSMLSTSTAKTSIQPVVVNKNMLNLGKSPSSITHKVFSNISYAWKDKEGRWIPFLGIGGDVEFSQDNYKTCCCCDCNTCNTCTTTGTTNTTATTTNCGTNCGSCCNTGCGNSCGNNCGSCCDSCCSPRGAVSIWGVWIKGGLAFD